MTDETQAHEDPVTHRDDATRYSMLRQDIRTPLQLQEDGAAEAFAKLPRAVRLARMLDALLVEAKNQVKHNAPVSPSIVQQLEAIRALLG